MKYTIQNDDCLKQLDKIEEDTRNRVIGCRDLIRKCKDCNLKECIGCEYSASDIETTFKNFVSKDKIRELIEKLNKLLPDIDYRDIKDKQEREYYKKEYHKVVAQINVLKNLLKGE